MTRTPRSARRRQEAYYARKWSGPSRPYDLVKEFVIACGAVALIVVVLAVLFGSPDEKAISLQRWATVAPNDFVATAATELDGTSATATYGAPYNHNGPGQKLGPLPLARWGGVRQPVDTVNDFVIGPLQSVTGNPVLTAALAQWSSATAKQQQSWATAYDQALAGTSSGDPAQVKPGDYGPVPVLLQQLLGVARAGGLDGALTRTTGFYTTNYTKPLLFLADGSYIADQAQSRHLSGDQWGMMNETGNYPGQPWMWLYTFWYQISPFNHSGNADALVWGVMALLTLGFVLLPFIPGLRSLPRRLPVHRLIWRQWYSTRGREWVETAPPARGPGGDGPSGDGPTAHGPTTDGPAAEAQPLPANP